MYLYIYMPMYMYVFICMTCVIEIANVYMSGVPPIKRDKIKADEVMNIEEQVARIM